MTHDATRSRSRFAAGFMSDYRPVARPVAVSAIPLTHMDDPMNDRPLYPTGVIPRLDAEPKLKWDDRLGRAIATGYCETQPADTVNHPAHYNAGKVECIDALDAATTGLAGIEAVCTANAIKYLWRWKQKNGAEDLKKARWYINRLLGETA